MADFNVSFDYVNTIDGKPRRTAETRSGINPASEELLPAVPVSSYQDVEEAVAAARKAFPQWSATPHDKRAEAVNRFSTALENYKEQFAELLTQEQGKPLMFARLEIGAAISFPQEYSKLILDEEIIDDSDQRTISVRYTPLGVAVAIVPWNFPIAQTTTKLASAVLTGNTIIIKPSPFTPYCTLKLGELAQRFFPPGVVQVLSGDDQLGPWLVAHPGVDKIAFTGSTATGKRVMECASQTLKRVTLELGGNDPAIVLPDVDVRKVAKEIGSLAFVNSGQVCLAIKRIYVHDTIYEEFRAAIAEYLNTIQIGNGAEDGVFLGPVQNKMQYDRVKSILSEIEEGALIKGALHREVKTGYFINPIVVDKPEESSRLVVEEPFGPVVPLLTWNDEKDVIYRANNTIYGLGASVWTNDIEAGARISRQLDAGTVWLNTHFEQDPNAPAGGHKQSGLGYESSIGGLRAYCNIQTLYRKK